MGTYLDLQNRIIREMQRDDLSDTLAASLTTAIADAIDYYADKRFWFNEWIATANTTANNEYISLPNGTTFRNIDLMAVTVGATQYTLKKQELTTIEEWAKAVQTKGQPTDYAVLGSADIPTYRLWRMPNLVYPVTWIGVRDLTALVNANDSNSWTTYGQKLIASRAKMLLYRDQYRDLDGAKTAAEAEAEAYSKLKRETAKRLGTGRMRSSW